VRAASRLGPLRRWWLDRSMRAKGLTVVAVPLIALVGTVSASLLLQNREAQVRRTAVINLALSDAASQVLTDALNGETAVRAYAATGKPVFLAPYNLVLGRIGHDRQVLRAAAAAEGDPARQHMVDVTAAEKMAQLASVRSAVSRGVRGSDLLPALQAGKVIMDRLRRQVTALAGGPAVLVAAQRREIGGLETAIERLNLAGLALGLLAGIAGVALFTSGISRRVAAAGANADRLGEGQPLEPAGHSGDELGRLADSLVRAERLLASRSAELTAARDEALRATQAKSTFLSRTSHELRTPLNSILGFAQLLEMSDLTDEDGDSASRILSAGRHLLALINELIDIARIESGELSFSVEPVLVAQVVGEVSRLLAPLAAERSITITRQCPHPALAVRADRQRLSQIVLNLASNAVKYNRSGGAITITCRDEGAARASVLVADTGPGMADEDLERIFVPFERLGAEQTGIEGTGIGLPLSKALTEAMGGRLSASSVLGEGSVFTVTLPRAPDVVQAPRRAPGPAPSPGPHAQAGTATRILYMEDNPANVEVVARFLNGRAGFTLQSVASGRSGIDCAVRDVPDIILLDIHLPDIPGDQVLSELRAEPATAAIPVVVLSADATPGAIRRLRARGARAYLTKPLDLAELGDLLDSLTAAGQDPQDQPATRASTR
jgi:signal transduction histidine kinase/ActR/RegA family two-component response regulator